MKSTLLFGGGGSVDSKAFDFAEYTRIAISCTEDGVLRSNTPKSVRFAVAAIAGFETKMNFGHIPSTLLRDQHSCTSEQQLILRPTETMVATGQNQHKSYNYITIARTGRTGRSGKVPCLEIALL